MIRYMLSAELVCHDTRFAMGVEMILERPAPPGAAEASKALWDMAKPLMSRYKLEDHQVELNDIRIRPMFVPPVEEPGAVPNRNLPDPSLTRPSGPRGARPAGPRGLGGPAQEKRRGSDGGR